MLKLEVYDTIIDKLSNADKPLSVDGQKRLAQILSDFRLAHDRMLWQDSILQAEIVEDRIACSKINKPFILPQPDVKQDPIPF